MALVSADEMENARNEAKERYIRYVFVYSADRTRYGRLIEDLENSYTQGDNKYPKMLMRAFNLLIYWKCTTTQEPLNPPPMNGDGLSFITTDGEKHSTRSKRTKPPIKQIQCFRCKSMGHYAGDCTGIRKDGNTEEGKTMLLARFQQGNLNPYSIFVRTQIRVVEPYQNC